MGVVVLQQVWSVGVQEDLLPTGGPQQTDAVREAARAELPGGYLLPVPLLTLP